MRINSSFRGVALLPLDLVAPAALTVAAMGQASADTQMSATGPT